MASKKPRKKKAPPVEVVEPPTPSVPSPTQQKPPPIKINPRDLMPHGLYKQIQELNERLKKVEAILETSNK